MKQLSRAIKTMLTVALLLISAPVWAADAPLPSLYERLGGTGPITAVVGKFVSIVGARQAHQRVVCQRRSAAPEETAGRPGLPSQRRPLHL